MGTLGGRHGLHRPVITFHEQSALASLSNGTSPVISSTSDTPKLYTSLPGTNGSSAHTSGAMKANVPGISPLLLSFPARTPVAGSRLRARSQPSFDGFCANDRPKSAIFTTSPCVTKTFDGFKSRWYTPLWCKYAIPRAICCAHPSFSAQGGASPSGPWTR
eukprot:gene8736-biopygen8744